VLSKWTRKLILPSPMTMPMFVNSIKKIINDFKHGTNFEYPQKPIQGRNFETDSRDLNDVFIRPRFHQLTQSCKTKKVSLKQALNTTQLMGSSEATFRFLQPSHREQRPLSAPLGIGCGVHIGNFWLGNFGATLSPKRGIKPWHPLSFARVPYMELRDP